MNDELSTIRSVTLVRHGDHKSNILTETGRKQAEARRFPEGSFDLVIVSKQPRTQETASIIAPDCEWIERPELYPDDDLVTRLLARVSEVGGNLTPSLYLEVPEIAPDLVEFAWGAAEAVLDEATARQARDILVVNHAPGIVLIANEIAMLLGVHVNSEALLATNLKPCEGIRIIREGVETLTNEDDA